MARGKPIIIGLALLGMAAWGYLLYQNTAVNDRDTNDHSKSDRDAMEVPSRAPLPTEQNKEPVAHRKITLLPGTSIIEELHRPDKSGEDDLHVLDTLLLTFRQAIKSNPSGENYEIIEALTGSNQKGVAVIPANYPSISTDGELLDRWGSPYHFHSISSQKMEIRSAGPDGQLWNDDDITLQD